MEGSVRFLKWVCPFAIPLLPCYKSICLHPCACDRCSNMLKAYVSIFLCVKPLSHDVLYLIVSGWPSCWKGEAGDEPPTCCRLPPVTKEAQGHFLGGEGPSEG
jgi:hypothetical protein